MKILKSHIRLTALVLSFVFTNTALAAESTTNESKDNGTGNTISNADLTNNANSNAATSVTQSGTAVSNQQVSQAQTISDAQSYHQQREEHRQQVQKAQQEAYKRFLERRKQYSANNPAFDNKVPAHVQDRRNEQMKQMEERRAYNIKMMEERRKAAEERRKDMQLKMRQTNTTPESTAPESANKV